MGLAELVLPGAEDGLGTGGVGQREAVHRTSLLRYRDRLKVDGVLNGIRPAVVKLWVGGEAGSCGDGGSDEPYGTPVLLGARCSKPRVRRFRSLHADNTLGYSSTLR